MAAQGFSFDAEYGGMATNSLLHQFPALKQLKLLATDYRGLGIRCGQEQGLSASCPPMACGTCQELP